MKIEELIKELKIEKEYAEALKNKDAKSQEFIKSIQTLAKMF